MFSTMLISRVKTLVTHETKIFRAKILSPNFECLETCFERLEIRLERLLTRIEPRSPRSSFE